VQRGKARPNQLQNSTLLGQATWSSFTVPFLCCFPVALLLLLGRPLRLLSSCTGSGGRGLGLRLGTAMQSVDLGNGFVEGLALSLSNLELESGRLARTVGTLGESVSWGRIHARH
jgi:hypothetical protein